MIENIALTPHTKSAQNLKKFTGAYLVSFAVFSERFSFWGLQAIMVLFLMHAFSQSEKNAFTLISTFGALSYALSLFGGIISDKLLGVWKSCALGLFFCLLGNTILIFSYGITNLNAGLACILVGAGLFSPSSNAMIRILYEKKCDLKESAFLIICVAGNISGALSPLIYGLFETYGIGHDAFFISMLLNSFSLLFFFKNFGYFHNAHNQHLCLIKNTYVGYISVFFSIIIVFELLLHTNWLDSILLVVVFPFCYWFFNLYHKLSMQEKKRINFIFLLTIILMLFYISVFQIYSSLTIFIEHYVNKNILGLTIPIPAFASLQCIFFILCAPLVDKTLNLLRQKGYALPLLAKIPIGLIIGSIGFLIFATGEWTAQQLGSCDIEWIILGNFFLGLGEVFLYPPILTAIASFSPQRLTATFMGIFSLSLALANYFSGKIAIIITDKTFNYTTQNISIFHLMYAKIALALIAIALMNSLIFSRLNTWYHEQEKMISIKENNHV